MYFDDHAPPHFHAFYGEYQALMNIETLAVLRGHLPPRAHGLVVEWASLQQGELRKAWNKVKRMETPDKIASLE